MADRIILPSVGYSPANAVTVPSALRNDPIYSRWYTEIVHVLWALRQADPGVIDRAAVEAAPYIDKVIKSNIAPDIIEKILDILIVKRRDIPPGTTVAMVIPYIFDKLKNATDITTRSMFYQILLDIKAKHLREFSADDIKGIDFVILQYLPMVDAASAARVQSFIESQRQDVTDTRPKPTTPMIYPILGAVMVVGTISLLYLKRGPK
jgi:hypothetical protein